MNKHLMSKMLFAAMCGGACLAVSPVAAAVPDSVYLMSYNVHPGGGLNFAWSADKNTWKGIGLGHAFVKSDFGTWGAQKKMFNPSLLRMPDGTWRCVFQVNDNVNQFAVAGSKDLITWQPQDYPYMEGVGSCLSPVLSYDATSATYKVVFKTKEGDVYATESKDFYRFSKPRKVDASAYVQTLEQAMVDGQTVTGQVTKVAYPPAGGAHGMGRGACRILGCAQWRIGARQRNALPRLETVGGDNQDRRGQEKED